MKRQILTKAIVLSRTDYQEAARIITFLTPDYGKLRVIAKGVRRPASKMAAGIELFSVSNVTVLPGRGDLGTLVSTRLISHFGNIVTKIERTMLGYEVLKRINRITEDAAGPEYFELLHGTLEGLNDTTLSLDKLELWFSLHLLAISGHTPNLQTDIAGNKLQATSGYLFDFKKMAFQSVPSGVFKADHIKLLRLALNGSKPTRLANVVVKDKVVAASNKLARDMLKYQRS